jgi:hypothetical protein
MAQTSRLAGFPFLPDQRLTLAYHSLPDYEGDIVEMIDLLSDRVIE